VSVVASEQQLLELFLRKIDALPAFPKVVSEVIRLLENPMTSIDKIESMLMTDTGLTIKTLKIANSAYYSIPGGAKTVKRAVTFLGISALKEMLITTAVFDQLKGPANGAFDEVAFWKHSFGTAALSNFLSKELGHGNPEEAFICGLVHDMGKVLFQMYDAPEFERVIFKMKEENLTYETSEKALSATKHSVIGSMMAKKWNLPLSVQSAINDHHNPNMGSRLTAIAEVNDLVNIVYLANRLEQNFSAAQLKKPAVYNLDSDEVVKRLNLKQEDFDKMAPAIEETLNSAESLFRTLF